MRLSLWEAQKPLCYKFKETLRVFKSALNLSNMGTGKTIMTLKIISDMMFLRQIDRCFIIVRNANMLNWYEEIHRYDDFKSYPVLKFDKRITPNKTHMVIDHKIIIIGYEMFRSRFEKLSEIGVFTPNTYIVCDEVSKLSGIHYRKNVCYRGHVRSDVGSQIALIIKNLIKITGCYFTGLTGTPISSKPLDAYNLIDIFYRGNYMNFFEFRAMFCTLAGSGRKKFIVGFKNLETLKNLIESISGRITLDDLIEMPEMIRKKRVIEITGFHNKLYNAYKKQGFVYVDEQLISAKNSASHFQNAMQLSSDPGIITGKWSKLKYKVLLEDLREIGNDKVIIACHYVKTTETLSQWLKQEGYKVVTLYGATKDREQAEKNFRGEGQLLVGNSESIGYGLNLQFCKYIINYETTSSPRTYEQLKCRIYRAGQKNTTMMIDYIIDCNISWKIYNALQKGIDLQEQIIRSNADFKKFM